MVDADGAGVCPLRHTASDSKYHPAMHTDLLAGLNDDERRLVVARMIRRTYRQGDTLFFEGDREESLHVIQAGRVAIRTSTPNGDVVTLTVMGPGECFGEQALLSADLRRTASVVALEDVETRMLDGRDFEDLRRRHPVVERFLVEVLAAQVRRLSAHVLDALYTPAEKRIVRRLNELVRLYGATAGDTIPIRQEDLATMAGTTRPTANRVLKALEVDGVVRLARGRTVVIDPAALADRAL
jgi:CRP/FNR family cyclic AMP-dependent transcriptional regulator